MVNHHDTTYYHRYQMAFDMVLPPKRLPFLRIRSNMFSQYTSCILVQKGEMMQKQEYNKKLETNWGVGLAVTCRKKAYHTFFVETIASSSVLVTKIYIRVALLVVI